MYSIPGAGCELTYRPFGEDTMHRMLPSIPAGLLGLVLLMALAWQPGNPALAQAQTQSALDSKGTLPRGPATRTASAQSGLASKKVLILHSFGYAQPAYKIIDQSLTETFVASGLDFNNLYFEFMDLARNHIFTKVVHFSFPFLVHYCIPVDTP